jgi:DNA-binding MarR family transcriptional regulator
MRLHTILQDRAGINILKVMHMNEYVDKKSHTMTYTQLRQKLGMADGIRTLRNLSGAGLIAKENVEEELVISLTGKGRRFLEQFDRLVSIYDGAKEEPPAFKVEYDLTELEKKILMSCYTLKTGNGGEIAMADLAKEVYPHKDPSKSKATLSKYLKKLEELNLIARVTKSNKVFLDTTPSGEKVAKEEMIHEKADIPVEAGSVV